MECEAAETGKLDAGVYGQLVNTLTGILNKLGLDKQIPKTVDLHAYVNGSRRK